MRNRELGNIFSRIGDALEFKGEMKKYMEAMEGIPPGLLVLLNIQGMGPKTLRLAHDKLGVKSRADLGLLLRVIGDTRGLSAEEKRISIGIALPLGMMGAMRFGVGVARRAWLSKGDVLNTLLAAELESWLKDRI